MKALQLITVLLITGCATPTEIMEKPADAKVTLKQRPEMATACIARNIDRRVGGVVSERRPTPEGWELISRIMGEAITVYFIAQVRADGSGSEADVWTLGSYSWNREQDLAALLKGC